MRILRFTHDGQPVSAKNHPIGYRTTSGRVRVRQSAAITAWYGQVVPRWRAQFEAYQCDPVSTPAHVTVWMYVAYPLDSPANPDTTNVLDGVMDALQHAGVLVNDRQAIAGSWAMQYDPDRPRLVVEVRPMPVALHVEGGG